MALRTRKPIVPYHEPAVRHVQTLLQGSRRHQHHRLPPAELFHVGSARGIRHSLDPAHVAHTTPQPPLEDDGQGRCQGDPLHEDQRALLGGLVPQVRDQLREGVHLAGGGEAGVRLPHEAGQLQQHGREHVQGLLEVVLGGRVGVSDFVLELGVHDLSQTAADVVVPTEGTEAFQHSSHLLLLLRKIAIDFPAVRHHPRLFQQLISVSQILRNLFSLQLAPLPRHGIKRVLLLLVHLRHHHPRSQQRL
mmetsp:Transcript_26383/g.68216  ORF Transcript_26383/g.68216 Transcript_26383/m.68216 type:complete len:248 (+) Transcript_26383:1058-1801(+)